MTSLPVTVASTETSVYSLKVLLFVSDSSGSVRLGQHAVLVSKFHCYQTATETATRRFTEMVSRTSSIESDAKNSPELLTHGAREEKKKIVTERKNQDRSTIQTVLFLLL